MLTGLILMAAIVAQNPPADLRDLVGARAAGAETQMTARGYVFVRVETLRRAKLSRWWSEALRQCVAVTTANGRYSAIVTVPSGECGQRLRPLVGGRERDRLRPEPDNGK
jgi:hypothetical protein